MVFGKTDWWSVGRVVGFWAAIGPRNLANVSLAEIADLYAS